MEEELDKKFDRYITIDKIDYVVSRKKKKKYECIFCEIAKRNPDVNPNIVYEDEKAMVILNIYPFNPGHLMVIPKKHLELFEELIQDEMNYLMKLTQASVELLKKIYEPEGFNIGINQGEAAGASVLHFHIHVVPRYEHEFGFMEVAGSRVIVEETEDTLRKLRTHAHEIERYLKE